MIDRKLINEGNEMDMFIVKGAIRPASKAT
jgi:hypothetical protein